MKSYLQWSDVIVLLIASIVGVVVGSSEYLKSYFSDRYFYAMCLFILFFFIHIIIEIGAVRKLSVAVRGVWIIGNPLWKLIMFRALLLSWAGWFVLGRFELGDLLSYLSLAVLSALFVGDIFNTFRFMRGRKLGV